MTNAENEKQLHLFDVWLHHKTKQELFALMLFLAVQVCEEADSVCL